MENPLQHLRSVPAEDLPPGFPNDPHGPIEYPVTLTCGCIVGSSCLERSFEKGPRCPLCNTTIRVIAGVDAPLNHNPSAYLQQLEQRSGINDWPLPSIESSGREVPDGAGMEHAEHTKDDLQGKLDVLNACHGTFLSLRELEVCVGLADYRLDTRTSVADVFDAFFKHPLFDPSLWDRERDGRARRSPTDNPSRHGEPAAAVHRETKDVLALLNARAGTSFLSHELELVLSLMNFVHRAGLGLRQVLGLPCRCRRPSCSAESLAETETELVGAFGRLDVRVGARDAVQGLADVFSQATL